MVGYQDSGLIRMLTGALFKNISALWPFQLQFNGTACSIIVPFVWDIILILMRIAMTLMRIAIQWNNLFSYSLLSLNCLQFICRLAPGVQRDTHAHIKALRSCKLNHVKSVTRLQ